LQSPRAPLLLRGNPLRLHQVHFPARENHWQSPRAPLLLRENHLRSPQAPLLLRENYLRSPHARLLLRKNHLRSPQVYIPLGDGNFVPGLPWLAGASTVLDEQ